MWDKFKWWIFGGLSIMSIILSIISFCSFECYDSDKISLLMGSFSIFVAVLIGIVALLIGWNIYSVIDAKRNIKNAMNIDQKINEVIKKTEKKWQSEMILSSPLFSTPSDASLAQRIASNLIVFYALSDESSMLVFARQNIWNISQWFYDNNRTELEQIANEISHDERITQEMVVKFYNDFMSATEKDKKQYKGVEILFSKINHNYIRRNNND